MASCSNCGSDNPDGSKFCGNCGTALQTGEAEPTPAVEPTPPVDPAPPAGPPAGYTPEHAAYNEALAAINAQGGADAPATEQPTEAMPPATQNLPPAAQPPVDATTPQPPVTSVTPPPLAPTPPVTPTTETMPPTVTASGADGSSKKVLAIVGGIVGLLLILGAVWFFFIRDDSEPNVAQGGLEEVEGTTEEDPAEGEVTDDTGDVPADDPVDPAAFDSIQPFIAQSAGPYSITQESPEQCEPPCIFPESAHAESLETYQATWDAGSPESEIYGEFIRYPTDTEAAGGIAETVGFLESSGYAEVDSFELQGVPGTVYQSPDSEILLWQGSNLMMGLVGNKGYPIEFIGYLNQ